MKRLFSAAILCCLLTALPLSSCVHYLPAEGPESGGSVTSSQASATEAATEACPGDPDPFPNESESGRTKRY